MLAIAPKNTNLSIANKVEFFDRSGPLTPTIIEEYFEKWHPFSLSDYGNTKSMWRASFPARLANGDILNSDVIWAQYVSRNSYEGLRFDYTMKPTDADQEFIIHARRLENPVSFLYITATLILIRRRIPDPHIFSVQALAYWFS